MALVIGIIITDPIWVLFSTIALLVLGLAEAWWRWGATGIEYRRILSSRTLSCGDTLECVIEVTNRKLLPMPWLDTSDDWPAALMPATARHRVRPEGRLRVRSSRFPVARCIRTVSTRRRSRRP
ncbi:MAG: hypothetical protein EBT00_09830 [Proteobacteria bacterium]|nr:hypothetical protein [Pseudomonadota bacterium]